MTFEKNQPQSYIRDPLIVASLAALCLIAYSNSFYNEFHFDDFRLIRFNFWIRDWKYWKEILLYERFRPLVGVLFAVNYQIGQKDPFSYHVVNLALHMIVVLLFYRFLLRCSFSRLSCFFAAGLFAIHPLNTESVAYVSGRSIVLCAAMYLSAMLAFDSYLRTNRRLPLYLFVLFTALGVFSREEALLIPVAALLYNAYLLGTDSVRKHAKFHVAGIIAVFAAAGLRFVLHQHYVEDLPVPVPVYMVTEIPVWLRYLWLGIFPVSLNIDHDVQPVSFAGVRLILSAAGVAAILFALWRARKTHPFLSFWGFWFFLNLLVSSSLIPLNDFMAEHRSYISTLGICAVAAYPLVAFRNTGRSASIAVALIAVLFFFTAATLRRNAVWATNVTLWSDAVQKSPKKFRPHVNLGTALLQENGPDHAIVYFLVARSLNPKHPAAYTGLGLADLQRDNTAIAEQNFRIALRLDPNWTDAQAGLGLTLFRTGNCDEALPYLTVVREKRKESIELVQMIRQCQTAIEAKKGRKYSRS